MRCCKTSRWERTDVSKGRRKSQDGGRRVKRTLPEPTSPPYFPDAATSSHSSPWPTTRFPRRRSAAASFSAWGRPSSPRGNSEIRSSSRRLSEPHSCWITAAMSRDVTAGLGVPTLFSPLQGGAAIIIHFCSQAMSLLQCDFYILLIINSTFKYLHAATEVLFIIISLFQHVLL